MARRLEAIGSRFAASRMARRPWMAAAAGPALIIVATLVVMRHYAFEPRMEGGDMTTYWLPLHCFMGKALRAGHIPGWDPFAMSGMPFAPDPQAGWLSIPAMAMFTALPCGVAIRWLAVLLVAGTGLGMYWFLRGEECSRPAATIGGTVLALGIGASGMAVTYRFAGAIAFTTLLLGAMARLFRASRWSARVGWVIVGALAFGQLAAAYVGMGLIVGTGTVAAYVVVLLVSRLRSRQLSLRSAAAMVGVVVVALALVNAAYFLPRLLYASRINVSLGYGTLSRLAQAYLGKRPDFPGNGASPAWPLNLSLVPGRYLGGVLVFVFAGFWSKRRGVVWAFAAVGLICYLASLQVVVEHVPRSLWSIGIVDQYLHRPHRLTFGVFIPIAVLAAAGIEAWREAASLRTRILMLAPGLAVWLLLPLGLDAPPRRLLFVTLGAVVAVACLAGARKVPALAPALVAALAAFVALELVASTAFTRPTMTFEPVSRLIRRLTYPGVDADAYLTPSPIVRALQAGGGGRYMTLGKSVAYPSLQMNQGMLFGIESTGGYLSVQLRRYWLFVRALSDTRQSRQYAFFRHPPPVVLDVLQVDWFVVRTARADAVDPGSTLVARDGQWLLFRRPEPVPRASLVYDWRVVPDADRALQAVAAASFDPGQAVLEEDPGIVPSTPSSTAGTATYVGLGAQAARVDVDAAAPAIVLVRNVYDPNWKATVDGRPVPLLAVDSIDQGVAVPAGQHVVSLRYDDPSVGYGLLLSLVALVVLCLAVVWLRRREADRARPSSSPNMWSDER
jgi:hypothetical protein